MQRLHRKAIAADAPHHCRIELGERLQRIEDVPDVSVDADLQHCLEARARAEAVHLNHRALEPEPRQRIDLGGAKSLTLHCHFRVF
ncbi:hypothetical protein [Roseicella frigidaeris]|uniref:hypothetical protein n=1 Tax=Roseicella frigidaeris TaxID=2230885 RepID=UPI000FDEDE7E|nr:hypothetical protein [Roseicella frigidaeris]